jgi:hypothetical protein
MSQVKLAMYKGRSTGKSTIGDALIRFWTRSEYSHCELIVDGISMSSSLRDKGVRAKEIEYIPEHWDIIDLPWADPVSVLAHFEATKTHSYSVLDIIRSQIFNYGSNQSRSAFCSEWCADALGLPNAVTYSPKTLATLCIYLNSVRT